jgi:UDP-N-acetylmuramate--alanine ligase
MIVERMAILNSRVLSKEAMKDWIKNHQPNLVVMAGAGDIDASVLPVKEIMMEYNS